MKKIVILLCLGLIGCSTVSKESKTPTVCAPAAIVLQPGSISGKLPVAKAGTTVATTVPVPRKMPTLTPQVALGLRPAGEMSVNPKEVDNIIAVLNQAVKNNPYDAGIYYNRAVAYFYKKNYDLSWEDVHKAEDLGIKDNPKFTELVDRLKAASGRKK